MIVASQMYTKLFRPWDVPSENKNFENVFKDANVRQASLKENVSTCENTVEKRTNKTNVDARLKRSQIEKANKLRKIRNKMIHQDATISTTTDEYVQDDVSSRELRNLEEINKRLGCSDISSNTSQKLCDKQEIQRKLDILKHHSFSHQQKYKEEIKTVHSAPVPIHHGYNPCYPEHLANPVEVLPYADPYSPTLQRFPGDLLTQAELAQSLGIPPTDPLLLESFAQGYAMELEYARILHEENQTKLLNAKKQRPKKYKCPHCDVGFSNNGQLKGHIRIHTGERPFKCDDKNCGKTFTRNEELTRHRRIHSGLRPYPCPTCGKKFGRRDHLKKHTKTHLAQAERMMPMFVPLSALPVQYPYLYGY